jgi:hypothetical protein
MAGALFFISLFFITLIGGLLLRPDPIQSIRHYQEPAALESRKKVTLKMAAFLSDNPKIVEQKTLKSLPLKPITSENGSKAVSDASIALRFQGSDLHFQSQGAYDAWLVESMKSSQAQFLRNIDFGSDEELAFSTLHKISEIDSSPEVQNQLKEIYLEKAKRFITTPDGYAQQVTSRALQAYLNLEKDQELGKRRVNEILQLNNTPPDSQ